MSMRKQYRDRANSPKILFYAVLAILCGGIFLVSLSWAGESCPTTTTPTSAPDSRSVPDSSKHTVPDRPPDAKNTPRDIGNTLFDGIPNSGPHEERLFKSLTPTQLQELKNIGTMIGRGGSLNEAQNIWKVLVERSKDMDIDAAIKYILREAKIEAGRQVQLSREKVQLYDTLKEEIRAELTRTRITLSEIEKGKPSKIVQRKLFDLRPGLGKKVVVKQEKVISTPDDIEAYIKDLEEKLNEVGEDQQLAQIDLQNKLQYSQQLLQTLSNVSKMLYDTMMAIIRKIGG